MLPLIDKRRILYGSRDGSLFNPCGGREDFGDHWIFRMTEGGISYISITDMTESPERGITEFHMPM